MTAAALPLLTAGTLLSTTDAANAATQNDGQNGTTLNASISAGLTQDKTYAWDVTKTAGPVSLDIWKGDAGKVHYTVNVTKHDGQLGAVSLSGQVTVTNNGSVATTDLTVKAFLEQEGTGSQWNMVGSVHQLSVPSQLQPGQTGNYQFGWPVSGYQPGGTCRVEAPITVTNHSSYLGQPYGPTPKADVGYTVNEVNGTVAVVDSDPDTGVFPAGLSQSGSFAYDYQVTGDHTDTVQVLSADQNQVLAQASATVKVNVWSLDIAKAVTGASFTRTYNWSLGKPDPASLKVHVGEQASYSVPVTVTATDSGWKVECTITIHNPAPIKADISGVMDTFPGAQIADPIPTSLASGETVVLRFTLQPGSGQAGTNHAEVKLSNGTVVGADAAFDFSNAQVKEVDKTATITSHAEIKGGDSGQVSSANGTVQVSEP